MATAEDALLPKAHDDRSAEDPKTPDELAPPPRMTTTLMLCLFVTPLPNVAFGYDIGR